MTITLLIRTGWQRLWRWLSRHVLTVLRRPDRLDMDAGALRRRMRTVHAGRQTAKPDWVRREVIRLKALMPSAGCRTIAHAFNRRHAALALPACRASVGKTYVADLLRRHRYEVEVLRRNIKHRMPPPMPRNRIWALDLTGKQTNDGAVHAILGLIDHGTRLLLALESLPNKSAWTLLGHLFIAIGQYGKPRLIRTDNEAIFKSRLFTTALKLIGIDQQFTDPGCPWMNGRIERLFLTLKQTLDQVAVASFNTLNQAMHEFRFFYNHVRPHQHLQGRTPAEAWVGVNPFAEPPKHEHWFEAWDGLLQGFYLRR